MRNHVTRAAAALTVAARAQAQTLAALRARLTALTFGSPYLSEVEQLRANHHVHECESPAQLRRWLANTRTELARRAAAAEQPHGTDEETEDVGTSWRDLGSRSLPLYLRLNIYPVVVDTLASSQDQQYAASFRPAYATSFAVLFSRLTCPSHA